MVQATDLFSGKEFCPGYRLVRLLGRGGYGSVWEAQGDGQTVALKFLPCDDQCTAAREIRSIQAIRSRAAALQSAPWLPPLGALLLACNPS
jgi:hypothetical protein